jgi:hypothetical protein
VLSAEVVVSKCSDSYFFHFFSIHDFHGEEYGKQSTLRDTRSTIMVIKSETESRTPQWWQLQAKERLSALISGTYRLLLLQTTTVRTTCGRNVIKIYSPSSTYVSITSHDRCGAIKDHGLVQESR